MTYACPNETYVVEAAARLNRRAQPWECYVVERYPDGTLTRDQWRYGIVRRYRYLDDPSSAFPLHGGFVWFNRVLP